MSASPFDFIERDGVLVRDWAAIYGLDRDPGDPFEITELLPAQDVEIDYQSDGVVVIVSGIEGLKLAEVKAASVAAAVGAMPDFVQASLKSFFGF